MPVRTRMAEVWGAEPEPVRAALVRTGCAKPWSSTRTALPGTMAEGPTQFGLELLEELDRTDVSEGRAP